VDEGEVTSFLGEKRYKKKQKGEQREIQRFHAKVKETQVCNEITGSFWRGDNRCKTSLEEG